MVFTINGKSRSSGLSLLASSSTTVGPNLDVGPQLKLDNDDDNNKMDTSEAQQPQQQQQTREELIAENAVLRNQLSIALEMERMLKEMFQRDEKLLQTGALRPYLHHTVAHLKKFNLYKRAMSDQLRGVVGIDGIKDHRLMGCNSSECHLAACSSGHHGQGHDPAGAKKEESEEEEDTKPNIRDLVNSNSNSGVPSSTTSKISSSSTVTLKIPPTTPRSFKRETRVIVDGIPKMYCRVEDCPTIVDDEQAMSQHMFQHNKLFKCSMCEALFSEKRLVYKHFVLHQAAVRAAAAGSGTKPNANNGNSNVPSAAAPSTPSGV